MLTAETFVQPMYREESGALRLDAHEPRRRFGDMCAAFGARGWFFLLEDQGGLRGWGDYTRLVKCRAVFENESEPRWSGLLAASLAEKGGAE